MLSIIFMIPKNNSFQCNNNLKDKCCNFYIYKTNEINTLQQLNDIFNYSFQNHNNQCTYIPTVILQISQLDNTCLLHMRCDQCHISKNILQSISI